MLIPNLSKYLVACCNLLLLLAVTQPAQIPEWGLPSLNNSTATLLSSIPSRSLPESLKLKTENATPFTLSANINRRKLLTTADSIIMPFSGFSFPYLNWPVNFAAAAVSQGNISALALTLLRLQERRCLNIVVLGGSISAGSSIQNEKMRRTGLVQPRGPMGAWPAWLKKYLDVYFPDCESDAQEKDARQDNTGSGHVIHNLAVNGWASDSWTLLVAEALFDKETSKFGAQLFGADLIFLETAINDVASLGDRNISQKLVGNRDKFQQSQVHTEILINQLYSLPKTPSVMFVGVSDRVMWTKRNDKSPAVRMVEAQSSVARYYGVPYISAMHALGPLTTAHQQNWFLNIYRCDLCCHLSTVGHRFVSSLIMRHLIHQYVITAKNGAANGIWPNFQTSSTYDDLRKEGKNSFLDNALRQSAAIRKLPPAPYLYCPRIEMNVMIHATPLAIDAVRQHPLSSTGDWSVCEDVRGKPGLIGTKIGASVVFGFDAVACRKQIIAGLLKLQLLKSYNKMGTMRLRLYAIPSNKAADCRSAAASGLGVSQSTTSTTTTPAATALGNDWTIDCLWTTRASVTVVETLSFPTTFTGSLCIHITVIDSSQARAENKIKLISITLM